MPAKLTETTVKAAAPPATGSVSIWDDEVTGEGVAASEGGDTLTEEGGQRVDALEFQQHDRSNECAAVGRIAPSTLEAIGALRTI